MINPVKSIGILYIKSCIPCLLAVAWLLCGSYGQAQQGATAHKGVLDLQHHSWSSDGLTNLNGEWAFYREALYTPAAFDTAAIAPTSYAVVPGFWNRMFNTGLVKPAFGYGTYRLQVLCPPGSTQPLQLKFLTVASAYKLFVNGRQLVQVGQVGVSQESTVPAFYPIIVPVSPVNNKLDIVIQVANFTYSTGGLWDFIKLGTPEQIHRYHIRNLAHDFFIAGSFLLMALFYLVIYFFFSSRISPAYFSIFCLLIGIRPLVTGELGIYYFAGWSWQLVKHIEFLSLYLSVPVLALFSFSLFPREFSKKVLYTILLISIPFVAAALFTPPFIFRYTLRPFQVFTLLTAVYGLYVYIRAVKYKRTGAVYFLGGFIVLFITVVNDVLYTSLIIQSTNLLYAGLYVLVICQATALSKQFFRAFTKIKKLNTQLEHINEQLQEKNETINQTNEQLSKLNAELDTLVFRTSHDLRSPITSILTMAEVIKLEDDKSKRNEFVEYQKKTLLRLNALITEILHYAKNKSTALHHEPVNLQQFVEDVLHDHLLSVNSANIEKIVEVKQPGPFETDKARLGMIMGNLISNGLKYHNAEQEHPYLKIKAFVNHQEAQIEVADNGQGIAQQHLNHIFTKFYQVNNSKRSGSGFGLYIVQEAIDKLGGSIRVESEVGKGTSFFIVIPNAAKTD